MKVFVTGVAGQLGHDAKNELNQRGHVVIGRTVVEKWGMRDCLTILRRTIIRLQRRREHYADYISRRVM